MQEGNPSALSGEEYRRTLEHELADATWSTTWKHRAPPACSEPSATTSPTKALSAQGKAESPYPGRPDPEIS